jgi:hypothetical protein
MKKFFVLPVFLVLCAACSNPLLKWIETSDDSGARTYAPSAKAITALSFGVSGEEVSIRGEPGPDGAIPIKVILPANSSLTGLGPSITYIGESITPPRGTPQTADPYTDSRRDFTGSQDSPQIYTVRAADGSVQPYAVEVYVKTAQSAEIVWLIWNSAAALWPKGW